MANSTYNKLWADAQVELNNLLIEELPPQPYRPENEVVLLQCLVTLYVRYVQIFRQLEECYDQVVHPQKRRVIRLVLDSVMGRVAELKSQMVDIELSEYNYMDSIVQDLKLTPADIEIPIPHYFISECDEEFQQRKAMVTNILNVMESTERPRTVDIQDVDRLGLEEAITIIQVAERARQGCLRAKLMKEIQKSKEWQRKARNKDPDSVQINSAAVCIQKVWRGYIQRKRTNCFRQEEQIFLGMTIDKKQEKLCTNAATKQANEASRRLRQKEYEMDYQKSIVDTTNNLRDIEGPDMQETMKEQIRQWFFECYNLTGVFPDYPEDEDGGSAAIFAEKTPEDLMAEMAKEEEEETNKKAKGKEEKGDKKKKDKGKGAEEEEVEELKITPSAYLADLEGGNTIFLSVWKNRSEFKNFNQKHEAELIKEEKRKLIEAEIRAQVDGMMRQELANLKLAVSQPKGPKPKGGKKDKKKKKKEKDLTADRSFESLCQELVERGLLIPTDNVKLQDYLGDYKYLGSTLRQTDVEPTPSLFDVRQVVALYAILPLGSQVVHEKAPLVNAMLLAGPAGVGKKMLVNAICQETGATLFDLSPLSTAGKYPGKSGLAMMLHMVFKVARLMQPSVIWIGDAEKVFYKKVPKEEKEFDPRRMKKNLPKIVQSIKQGERVLVLGTTNDPLKADVNAMCKLYRKIILIPRPDYASRYIMWKQLIKKNGGEMSTMDLSTLTKISDGYTQGHIVQMIRNVLTEHRIHQQATRPLTTAEFIPLLAKMDAVFKEEEAIKNWYELTPLGKKRAKPTEEEEAVKGKDAKKKGKK